MFKVYLCAETHPVFTLFTYLPTSALVYKDYSKGFGGKYGVQKENMDKSAVGWEYQEKLEKHESQKGKTFVDVWWGFPF